MNPIDRSEQLRADLARATAELEHHKSVKETIDSAHKELSREHAALRARFAELVAALRDAVGMLEELDGLDWGEEGMPFDVDFNHFAKVLARAESATPLPMREDPRYRGTDFRSTLDVNRASHGGDK